MMFQSFARVLYVLRLRVFVCIVRLGRLAPLTPLVRCSASARVVLSLGMGHSRLNPSLVFLVLSLGMGHSCFNPSLVCYVSLLLALPPAWAFATSH